LCTAVHSAQQNQGQQQQQQQQEHEKKDTQKKTFISNTQGIKTKE